MIDRRVMLLTGGAALTAGAWRRFARNRRSVVSAAISSGSSVRLPAIGNPTLGINVTPISYWTPVAFSDRLKASSGWTTYGKPAPVDANGYPTGTNGQRLIATMMPCEPGRYVLTHDGDLDARVQSATLDSHATERSVFAVGGTIGSQRQLIIDAIRRPPTFMHFVREQDAQDHANGQLFAPEFLQQLQGMNTLRFMDWMRINASPVTDRLPAVESCSYMGGVPVEVMAKLAKQVGAHPWLCVPHLATDALVQSMLAQLSAAGSLAPYLEYSNEVWNPGFDQFRYARDQAIARWGPGAVAGTFYGYRSGQIAMMARGTGARVVLGGQTVVPERAAPIWDGVSRAQVTDRDFFGWIIAAYVNGTLTNPNGPTLAFAERHDVASAIDNMLHSTGPGALSVSTMSEVYLRNSAVARGHNLKLLAYEGNMHLNPLPYFDAQKALVKSYFREVVESPAAAAVTEANLDAFGAAGGSLACLYNLSSPPSDGGDFGLAGSGSWAAIERRLALMGRGPS